MLREINPIKKRFETRSLSRQFGWRLDHSGEVYMFCYEVVYLHKHDVCMNNDMTFSEKILTFLRLTNVPTELICEISDESKQKKFIKMLPKFGFGPQFVEKQGISSNFVDRCLQNFGTIL